MAINYKKFIAPIFLTVLISFFFVPNARAAYLYNHVYVFLGLMAPFSNDAWLGQHTAGLMTGGINKKDASTILANNPNIKIFDYISGSGFYKDMSPSIIAEWIDIKNFAGAHGYPEEDAFFHYDQDKVWTSGERSTAVFVSGYLPGMVPGFPHGSATEISQSRVPSPIWGDPANPPPGWNDYSYNYKKNLIRDFYVDKIDHVGVSVSAGPTGYDLKGNWASGYFYDCVLCQRDYWSSFLEGNKIKEYIDDGSPNVDTWYTGLIGNWLNYIKNAWSAKSGKPALTMVNGNTLNEVSTPSLETFYCNYSDITLMESGLSPGLTIQGTETKLKQAFHIQKDCNKSLVWQFTSRRYLDNPSWNLDSGNIYYTVAYPNLTDLNIVIGNVETMSAGDPLAKKTSKGAMTAGSFYYDISAKRVYVWGKNSENPNAWPGVLILGLDSGRLFGLSFYYIFGRYLDRGYYYLADNYPIYNAPPGSSMNWFDAIGYNIGQPATGGVLGNGAIATDLWGNSSSGSSQAYKLWQSGGNDTDDAGNTLNTSHIVYARKFSNGYAVVRLKTEQQAKNGSNTKTFTLPFTFKKLNADGTLGVVTNRLAIGQGEGAILIASSGTIDTTPPSAPTGVAVN